MTYSHEVDPLRRHEPLIRAYLAWARPSVKSLREFLDELPTMDAATLDILAEIYGSKPSRH